MKSLFNKIPRGVIYHKVSESIRYLVSSVFMPLDKQAVVNQFETAFAKYSQREYCVAFPFARTAIYYVLKSLNLPRGSEVMLPPVTIKGIVDVVLALDLVPVYIDWDEASLNFKIDELRSKTGPNVRVVILTNLFGLVPDMPVLTEFFKSRDIFIIEDFSQCLNGRYDDKRIGTFGDIGIYSASSIKQLDTLGGGLAITNDKQLYEILRKYQDGLFPASRKFLIKKAWVNLVRNLATTRLIFSFVVFPMLQVVRKRNPESALKQTGLRNKDRLSELPRLWFCKYSSVQAKIGLSNIDQVVISDQLRIDNANYLKSHCKPGVFPVTTKSSHNVYWQLIVIVKDPVSAQAFFAGHGVDTATSSLELVSALDKYPNKTATPVAENAYRNGIFLPCFPGLTQSDLERVVNAANQFK